MNKQIKRYGSAIGIKREKIEEYKKLHSNAWPDVLKKIKECNISNYSIYLQQITKDDYILFGYFEYTGSDFDKDMQKMADDPTTQKWWELCRPCQMPLEPCESGQWWLYGEEVFHCD